MHWADVLAKEALGRAPHVLATAITPSGPIHVGNMREVLTTEAVHRALRDAGAATELVYIADDYDPLRKVYPFLHEDYEAHVGRPLREVPCPDPKGRPKGCGQHASYAEHFLAPFLANLGELGIHPTVHSAYDLYAAGRYKQSILTALAKTDACRRIIEEVSKRRLPEGWMPFNPQCPKCARITGVVPTAYEEPVMTVTCPCGATSRVDVTTPRAGKLPWRLDWPARWRFLGVTFEAFGKDHGAAGGSWDTGVPLVREVFDGQEPHHVMYEFLHLKGKGAMHSSTGLAVSAEEVLRMTPPEVLRFLLVRHSPRKHIDFDPGLGLLALADEFDRLERVAWGREENPGDLTEVERTYALSCPRGPPGHFPVQVNFRLLVTVAQMADDDAGVEAVLRRSGELEGALDEVGRRRLARRIEHVRYWLAHAAPESVRFRIQPTLPAVALDDAARAFLAELADRLVACRWRGQDVHDAIHDAAAATGIQQGGAFRAVYQAILGQDRGPRAGFFLASQDRGWVVARFREAASS